MDEVYSDNRFYVQINGADVAVFTEVSGLQIETEVLEYVEGGRNDHVHKLPGHSRTSNLILKRGVTTGNELMQWMLDVTQGSVYRQAVTVVMFDAFGFPILRWHFIGAYPVKWSGPQFNAANNSAAIETLELAHHGMLMG